MKIKQGKSPQNAVFSHPIRKMKADELKKVVGCEFYGDADFHGKCTGGMDNQGRNFS